MWYNITNETGFKSANCIEWYFLQLLNQGLFSFSRSETDFKIGFPRMTHSPRIAGAETIADGSPTTGRKERWRVN